MKFQDLFIKSILVLPKEVPATKNYLTLLKDMYNEYLELISSIKDTGKIIGINKNMTIQTMVKRQETFINGILDTIELYFDGRPSEAFEKLNTTINDRISRNKQMFRIGEYKMGQSFYRIRSGRDNYLFKSDEMFHIAFENRGNVSSQRYSIPGFPSLYVGKTIYVCWEELKRPDLNTFQVSRLENLTDLKFIDLTPPNFNTGYYNSKAFGYIMIWPLIAACSIKVQNPKNYFKPEYIVPQLLLQWVRNRNDVDGIRYNSTNIPMTSISREGEYFNLVFPVKKSNDSGLCPELSKYFKVSEPISWQSIQVTEGGDVTFGTSDNNYLDKKLPNLRIYNDKQTQYSRSVLGKLEYYLDYFDIY